MPNMPTARSDDEIDPRRRVLIVGAGFAGIGLGILLQGAGRPFTILEAASDVGGVWRDNVYPGAACDVMSHLYSFSFEPWPKWTRQFAPQAEILAYLRHCVDEHGLREHIRLHARVIRAWFDDDEALWTLETADGSRHRARVVVSAAGTFGRPKVPDLPGVSSFPGDVLHSAHWDASVSLAGKRVAVVGTGASAIQIVPEVAKVASRLVVVQRTPAWVLPKPDRDIGPLERALYARLPVAQWLHREWIYWRNELLSASAFVHSPRLRRLGEALARRHLRRSIADPALRAKLTPSYELGCKRVLPSNDFYPALARPNVELVASALREVRGRVLVAEDGTEREVDAIVFCTGFDVVDDPAPFEIRGTGGRDLRDAWREEARAYLGTTVPGFPNLFLITGPNTGLGHTSMIFMMESQFAYVLDALRTMDAYRLRWVDVRPEVLAAFAAEMERRAQGTTWRSGCKSWYLDRHGKSVALWPGYTFEYRLRTRRFDLERYEVAYETVARPRANAEDASDVSTVSAPEPSAGLPG
jgi:cation diffusion facilitator CzcD-associated flavoprotein CzcO